MSPQRIQLRRTRGWRKPKGAVVVSRPGKWGNRFRVARAASGWEVLDGNWIVATYKARADAVAEAVRLHRDSINVGFSGAPTAHTIRAELRGKDLACWCPLDQPCHADVLLEIANGDAP